jgi:phage-related protein
VARSTTLTIKVLADASQASRELDKGSGSVGKFQRGIEKAAIPAAAIGAGLLVFAKAAGKAASDAEQAAGAVDAVFGKTAGNIHKMASQSAESVGLASSEYETMAAIFGAQLKNMGTSADQLAPKTNDLIKLGADLAAQYGGTTSDAVSALSALLRGETDPIERYGVSIKQADIAAEEAKHGIKGLTGVAKKQADATAILTLLTKQTADAHGAFARESDTAAHAQQVANAKWEDAKATLGKSLLPIMVIFGNLLGTVAGVLEKNSTATTILLGVVGALAAAVLIANAALKLQAVWTIAATVATKAWRVATMTATAVQWALNAAMAANPIGVVIALVIALAAGIVLLYKKCGTFRNIVTGAFNAVAAAAAACWGWIKSHWPLLVAILGGPMGAALAIIVTHWDKIKAAAKAVLDWIAPKAAAAFGAVARVADRVLAPIVAIFDGIKAAVQGVIDAVGWLIDKIGNIHFPSPPGWLKKLNPFAVAPPAAPAPATPAAYGRRLAGGHAGTSGGGSGSIVINVNGALDPEAVARQIRAILGRHDVRIGRAARTATAPA